LPVEDSALRRENLVALHLRKAAHHWTDLAITNRRPRKVRTKDSAEVHVVQTRDGKPWMLVACKPGDTAPAKHLSASGRALAVAHWVQLVDVQDKVRACPEHGVRPVSNERLLGGVAAANLLASTRAVGLPCAAMRQ